MPLGPFTAKNVMSTISPWIVTPAALASFTCQTSAGTQTDPVPHPYLRDPKYGSYDLNLSVAIKPVEKANDPNYQPSVITNSNFKYMYWNHRQQLAHHTVTGCNMNPGDLLGSGTISGPTADPPTYGSMLELAWAGLGHGPVRFYFPNFFCWSIVFDCLFFFWRQLLIFSCYFFLFY